METTEHNLALGGRSSRFRLGIAFFSATLGLTVLLFQSGAHPLWRVLLFLPFAASAVFLFQAMYKTCVMRALRGERETACGVEHVASSPQRELDRLRARVVLRNAALSALVATAIVALLP